MSQQCTLSKFVVEEISAKMGRRHCKKSDVANIVKSNVCNEVFPAITSNIRLFECCECLDLPPNPLSLSDMLFLCSAKDNAIRAPSFES